MTWAHLLARGWCLSGKQRDERRQSSRGSCQTDALWNATELVWSIISPFSLTENIDKVSPQKVESSRSENKVQCGNFTETVITAISIPLLASRLGFGTSGTNTPEILHQWPVSGISLIDTLDICQNEMQFRILCFSLALVIPHPALSWHLCLVKCWICSSCFPVRTAHNCPWSCCQQSFLRS